jgi:hypothetical protein
MDQRTTALADGSIASSFLVKFGRPSRNTGSADERDGAISADQVLHFLNSSDIRRRIEKGNLMKKVFDGTGENRDEQVRRLYLFLLSRQPEPEELRIVAARLKGNKAAPKQAAADLAWALINSKEFLYRH